MLEISAAQNCTQAFLHIKSSRHPKHHHNQQYSKDTYFSGTRTHPLCCKIYLPLPWPLHRIMPCSHKEDVSHISYTGKNYNNSLSVNKLSPLPLITLCSSPSTIPPSIIARDCSVYDIIYFSRKWTFHSKQRHNIVYASLFIIS